jgi:hypothetical protein
MLNFLNYMLFSSIEYFGIFFLMLSVYRLNIVNYKKEIFFIVFLFTLSSYYLTIYGIYKIVPIPVIFLPFFTAIFVIIFKRKFWHSVIITIAGTVFYGALQTGIISLGIFLKVTNINDLDITFAVKTYVSQTISAVSAATIGCYIRIIKGGFGFSFRTKRTKNKTFIFVTIASIMIISTSLYLFYAVKNEIFFSISVLAFFSTSIAIAYFSFKTDKVEFH